ncbi:MAG: CHASE2 domain-containing protein [Nitrosomonadales bacterium]|nr:CHASE2 domain-containing protein [Nitrosomonadales bacterium]
MDQRFRAGRLPATTIRLLVALALLLALVVGALQWARLAPLRQIDALFYDGFMQLGGGHAPLDAAILIDIDDNSLSEVGQWPWPRYKIAQLLERIDEGKPAAIGLDITFPEADRTALISLIDTYRREFGLELGLDGIPPQLLDNDAFLGATMAEEGAIGAIHLLFDQTNNADVRLSPPKGIKLGGEVERLQLKQASGVLQNTFRIQSQLRYNGFINMQPDPDGKLRRIPLLLRQQDRIYPHLLLAGLMRAARVDTVTVAHDALGPLLQIGDHRIPVDASGAMLLRYPAAAQVPMVSALDVLRSGLSPQIARGKPVFLGTAAAALHDFANTPLDPQFPGLGIYAVGNSNILAEEYLREPEWSGPAALALSLLCGGVIAALFVFSSRLSVLLLGSCGSLGLIVAASAGLTAGFGIYLSPAAAVTTIVLCFMWLSVARYTVEKQRALVWLEQVSNTQRVAIESMAAVAETRDPETGGHIKRTQHYVRALAEELAREGEFPELLTPEYIELLYLSAPLHDVGKVGVQDHILLKPGQLDDGEFMQMKEHARYGQEIIAVTSKGIQGDNFLRVAGEIASYHHEKWDGTGYPYGLVGSAIPLSARLMAVADVYDALRSRRCYKLPFSHEKACDILRGGSGTHFDPVVVAAFFAIEKEVIRISQKFADAESATQPHT